MTAASVPFASIQERSGLRRERILAVVYLGLAAVLGLGLAGGIGAGDTTSFGLNPLGKPAIVLPSLVVPSQVTLYVLSAALAFLGGVQLIRGFGPRWGVILGICVVLFVFGFLTWAAAGKSMSLIGLLQTTVQRAVPITFGALSGVLCERAGVVNIAIEGMLLAGAFTGAVVGSATDNILLGLGAAAVVGGLLALVLAILAIRYLVDQIIAGTVINIF